MLSPRRKLLFTLLLPLAVVLLLELGLRARGFTFEPVEPTLVAWNPRRDQDMASGADPHVRHVTCLWVPRPGASVPEGRDGETIARGGYRGPQRSALPPEGWRRVVLLGESSIFGMGLPYQETAAATLERELVQRGLRVEVIDAGVIGYTVEQGLERYRALVRSLHPDVVVVAFGLSNEHLPAQGVTDRERIRRMQSRSAPSARLARWLREHSRIVQLLDAWRVEREGGIEAVRERVYEGWQRPKELTASFDVDWTGVRRVPPGDYRRALGDLLREVQADGARPIVVDLPCHPEGEAMRPMRAVYRRLNREVAAERRVTFLDVTAALASDPVTPGPSTLFEEEDYWHLDAEGQKALAHELLPLFLDGAAEEGSTGSR